MTPKYGTGKWETYAYEIKSGNTPAYNRSFGHVYMDVIEQGVTFPISIKLTYYQISEKGKGQEQLIYGIGNSVISANWKPNTYNVAYDANNGTDERITNTHTYDTSEVIQVNSFSRTGHQFKEWNTKPDGSGISYQNGQQIKNLTSVNGGTVILYAQWNEEVNNIIGKISESYINEYNDTVEKDLANKLDAPEEEKEPIEPAEQTDQKNEKEEMVIP